MDEIMSRRVSACNDLVNEVLSSDKVSGGGCHYQYRLPVNIELGVGDDGWGG